MGPLLHTSLIAILLGLSAVSVPAATVDIDVGLSRHVRYGRWSGVCVEGRNKSEDPDDDLVATLSIECGQFGPQGVGMRLSESFSLPAGSQRRQWFYTYIHASTRIVDVRLEDEERAFNIRERLEIGNVRGDLAGVPAANLTVGVLGRGRRLLGDYQRRRGGEIGEAAVTEVVIRARGQLPDAWSGYDLLDVLVVATGADGGDVDAEEVEGLRQWVAWRHAGSAH